MLSIPALEALNSELIDTLWNVNRLSLLLHGIQVYELIDTLWNVNRDFGRTGGNGRPN